MLVFLCIVLLIVYLLYRGGYFKKKDNVYNAIFFGVLVVIPFLFFYLYERFVYPLTPDGNLADFFESVYFLYILAGLTVVMCLQVLYRVVAQGRTILNLNRKKGNGAAYLFLLILVLGTVQAYLKWQNGKTANLEILISVTGGIPLIFQSHFRQKITTNGISHPFSFARWSTIKSWKWEEGGDEKSSFNPKYNLLIEQSGGNRLRLLVPDEEREQVERLLNQYAGRVVEGGTLIPPLNRHAG